VLAPFLNAPRLVIWKIDAVTSIFTYVRQEVSNIAILRETQFAMSGRIGKGIHLLLKIYSLPNTELGSSTYLIHVFSPKNM
jgi:hypothetical protein